MSCSPFEAVSKSTSGLVNAIAVDVPRYSDKFLEEGLITHAVYDRVIDRRIDQDDAGRARAIVQSITANIKVDPEAVYPKLLNVLRDLGIKDLAKTIEENFVDPKKQKRSRNKYLSGDDIASKEPTTKVQRIQNSDDAMNEYLERSIHQPIERDFLTAHQSQQPQLLCSDKEVSPAALSDNTGQIKRNINSLETSFKLMAAKIRREIMSSTEKMSEFSVVIKEALPQPIEGLKDHIKYASLEENNVAGFFHSLEKIYNFIDYELLRFIIFNFGSYTLQEEFQKYEQKVKKFCAETTIMELIACWEPRFDIDAIPQELIQCVTKMSWNSKTTKVEKLKDLKKYLSDAVPQERARAAFFINELHSSSVTAIWIIWTSNSSLVLDSLGKIKNDKLSLMQFNIIHMEVATKRQSSSKDTHLSTTEYSAITSQRLTINNMKNVLEQVNFKPEDAFKFGEALGLTSHKMQTATRRCHGDLIKIQNNILRKWHESDNEEEITWEVFVKALINCDYNPELVSRHKNVAAHHQSESRRVLQRDSMLDSDDEDKIQPSPKDKQKHTETVQEEGIRASSTEEQGYEEKQFQISTQPIMPEPSMSEHHEEGSRESINESRSPTPEPSTDIDSSQTPTERNIQKPQNSKCQTVSLWTAAVLLPVFLILIYLFMTIFYS